jgi:hypothetical protein
MTYPLSQGHLTVFEQCPRRYQYQYVDRLHVPLNPELQLRSDWGSQFHLLMQQQALNLPIAPDFPPEMARSAQALRAAIPEFADVPSRDAEHRRVWSEVAPFLVVTVYDLLIAQRDRAQILDWKTYPKPPQTRKLEHSWQTLLYPFVLVETSAYVPEQVSMTYWFVQTGREPESWRWEYDTLRHEQVQQRLRPLLTALDQCLQRYDAELTLFPAIAPEQDHPYCEACPFYEKCKQDSQALNTSTWTEQLIALPEVEI